MYKYQFYKLLCHKETAFTCGQDLLSQVHAGQRLARSWFLEIAFVHDVGMSACVCVCLPQAYKQHSRDIKPYNQLNKFVAFKNVTKLSMHGRDHCNEAHRDRNQANKLILTLLKPLVSLRGWFNGST